MATNQMRASGMPMARYTDLVVTETRDQVLVYDTVVHHIHTLNLTSAAVWRLCDGQHDANDLARLASAELGIRIDEAMVRLALTQLDDAGLLEEPLPADTRMSGLSRRSFMKRSAVVGAVAVPAIVSITAPMAASAQSVCPPGSCRDVQCPAGKVCLQADRADCGVCVTPQIGICGPCPSVDSNDCLGNFYVNGVKCNNCYVWACDRNQGEWRWQKVNSSIPGDRYGATCFLSNSEALVNTLFGPPSGAPTGTCSAANQSQKQPLTAAEESVVEEPVVEEPVVEEPVVEEPVVEEPVD